MHAALPAPPFTLPHSLPAEAGLSPCFVVNNLTRSPFRVYFLGLALMGAGWSFSYVAASVLGTQGFMSKIKDPREKILSQVTAEVGTNPSARPATASPHRPRLRDST